MTPALVAVLSIIAWSGTLEIDAPRRRPTCELRRSRPAGQVARSSLGSAPRCSIPKGKSSAPPCSPAEPAARSSFGPIPGRERRKCTRNGSTPKAARCGSTTASPPTPSRPRRRLRRHSGRRNRWLVRVLPNFEYRRNVLVSSVQNNAANFTIAADGANGLSINGRSADVGVDRRRRRRRCRR